MKKRAVSLLLLFVLFACCFSSCARVDHSHVRFKGLTWAVSTPLPEAEDFVENLPEGYSVRFAKKYTFQKLGDYRLTLILTDEKGKESTHQVTLRLILDEEPPTVTGVKDLSVVIGRGVSYLSGVKAVDNCDGGVTLDVDTSHVNLREVGQYPVRYVATDAAGNSVTHEVVLTVYEQEVTKEMLWAELDPVIDRIITDGMTQIQRLEAVYDYVYDNVQYTSTSDKSDWVRAAYEGLVRHRGDCYTYFALSKAFFERLGVENIDVQRDPDVAKLANERHYWNLVNLGTKNQPRWYHFDACHIKDLPKPWGFLMTDAQLAWYTEEKVSAAGVGNYFYAFDASLYPRTPAEKLNTEY